MIQMNLFDFCTHALAW